MAIFSESAGGIPGILLSTMPKSGSVYIWNAISTGLGIPKIRTTSTVWFFPDFLIHDWVKVLAKGGVCSQQHIDASWYNTRVLSDFLDKMVVHIRDPRSSTLEWVYHIVGYQAAGDPWLRYTHYCTDEFLALPMEGKIGYMIDHFLPDAADFISGWLDAVDDTSFKTEVLLTTYAEFVDDEMAYFYRIMDFYGIERSRFSFRPFTPKKADDPLHEGEWHFRNARTDEWRDAFTSEQIERAEAMIPDRLFERFGWPRQ